MRPPKPEESETITPVKARQGRLGRDMLYVLLVSLTLAVVAAVVLLTWASPKAPESSTLGHSPSETASQVATNETRPLEFVFG